MNSLSKNEPKEVYIDLSKKIKFGDTAYISIGTLLLSAIIMIIQLLIHLSVNNWIWDYDCFVLFLNFAYVIRSGNFEEPLKDFIQNKPPD